MNFKFYKIFRYVCLSVLLILLYALQTTPGLFSINGVRPVLVVPFALSVAIIRGEGTGAAYAVFAGLLWDLSSRRLPGFSALILMVCCVAAALLTIYLIRVTWFNIMLITAGTMLIYGFLDFAFSYLIWKYSGAFSILLYDILPMSIYTVLISPLIFLLVKKADRFRQGKNA